MTGWSSTAGSKNGKKFPLFAILGVTLLTTGCGSSAHVPISPPRDPLAAYVECMATPPISSDNPNQPAIALLGSRVVNQPIGNAYVDPGATASDPHDGDISSQIQVTGLSDLNTNVVGDYLARYNVTDSAKLSAVEVVRVIRVTDGTFARQTARDIGTTGTHMGYYEHLPVHYSDDPNQKFPLLIFQHGWFNARFLDPYTVQAPLSILEQGNLVEIIKHGQWDDLRPFIVLSPQKCVDAPSYPDTANRMNLFIAYAVNAYQVDNSRIYMAGQSQGSGDTWDYVNNYPQQLAAVVPLSGGYGTASGCALKETAAWAFNGQDDPIVAYQNQVDTVNSINACNPAERAKVTVFPGVQHNDIQGPVFNLTGLGEGLPQYDIYDESIYDWMLQHSRK